MASKGSDTTSSAEQSDTAVGGTVSGGGSGFGASGSFTASGYANWSKSSAEVNSAGGLFDPAWLVFRYTVRLTCDLSHAARCFDSD